jgi:hypothetical protein
MIEGEIGVWITLLIIAYIIVLSLVAHGQQEIRRQEELAKRREKRGEEKQKQIEELEEDVIDLSETEYQIEDLIDRAEMLIEPQSDIGRKLIVSKELLKSHKESKLNLKKQ